MAVDVKVDVNSIELTNFLKRISRKQKAVIKKGLNRVSNMAILMITKRTQSGQKPDGGRFIPYTKKSAQLRRKKGRQSAFVDLTDTGQMFRSLDFRQNGFKNTLLFTNKEREQIAFRHDTLGVGKRKTRRPFFAIGDREEDKIKDEFASFYFKEMRL